MAKGVISSALILLATLAVVHSVIVAVGRRRRRDAYLQNVPMDCKMEFNVGKRDGSNEVDFVVCAKNNDICTSRDVPPCTDKKRVCEGFKPQDVEDKFHANYPGAYANVCEEPDGELCLYTDVKHHECGTAKAQNGNELCITLDTNEVECHDIPEEHLQMIQSFGMSESESFSNTDQRSLAMEQIMRQIERYISKED